MKVKFKIGAISDVGLVRKNNEDNLFIPQVPIRRIKDDNFEYEGSYTTEKALFCVCDGMGGHNAGEVASFMTVDCLSNQYENLINNVKKRGDIQKVMDDFVSETNNYVYDQSLEHIEYQDMGTTMVGLYFYENGAYTVNVGDSRAYVLKGKKVEQLSEDHADPVMKNAITRFLGMPDDMGIILPDVAGMPCKVSSNKRFLLCSDGLTDLVSDEEIAKILIENKEPLDAAKALVEAAKQQGGRDNITVMVIDATPVGKAKMILKQPAVLILIAALIIAGGVKGYMVLRDYVSPVEGIRVEDVAGNIQNSRDYQEAKHNIGQYINARESQLFGFDGEYNNVGNVSQDIQEKRADFKVAIDNFSNSIEQLKQIVAQIDTSEKTLEEKHAEIIALTDANNQGSICKVVDNQYVECEMKKKALSDAVTAYNRQQEEIKRRNDSIGGGTSGGGTSDGGTSNNNIPKNKNEDIKPEPKNDNNSGDGNAGGWDGTTRLK